MSALFEKIREQLNSKLPFVCYCKPNSNRIIALFQKNSDLVEMNDSESGFAFVSFDNEKRYLIPESLSDVYFESVSQSDFILPKNKVFEYDNQAKIDFESLVKSGVEAIEKQQFQKVVLSRKEVVSVDDFNLELVFNQMIAKYQSAFKYCFFHPKVGFWMGATPEQFLKVEDHRIKTVALAGTQVFEEGKEFIWQQKEIDEQQIVTDFIVGNLAQFSTEVSYSKPYTHRAGNIVHIKTDIEAIVDPTKKNEIINALHPTPAVCGFPKEKAKQFILDNEGYNREFYAGFLGEWNKDFLTYKENQSDLFVNLRCMKIENNNVSLYIGCGINKGSNPEKEFLETVNKSKTLKNVL